MTDLGFGLVDRRSILVVLFTIGVSHLVLGNPIPIDTTNALTVFLGLLVLTGFIYASRSILRLFVAFLFALLRIPYDFFTIYKNESDRPYYLQNLYPLRGVRGVLVALSLSLKQAFTVGFFNPSFRHREWHHNPEWVDYFNAIDKTYGFLGIVDRLILVVLSFAITLPPLVDRLSTIGLTGIIVLMFVYILTGSFTLVIDDAMRKAEIQQQRQHRDLTYAAANPRFPSVITTKQEDPFLNR
jgi:hypothetical protein